MATLDPIADVRNLAEAELLRARATARAVARQSVFHVFAMLVGLIGLVMLVVAGFLALSEAYGPVNGALITGGLMLAVAFLVILVARPLSRGPDLEAAREASKQARADVASDAEALQAVLRILSGDASQWSAENRMQVLMAAFGAGLGLGMKSGRRKRE